MEHESDEKVISVEVTFPGDKPVVSVVVPKGSGPEVFVMLLLEAALSCLLLAARITRQGEVK